MAIYSPYNSAMKPQIDIHEARGVLGDRWGLGRPLSYAELARALAMAGSGGDTVRSWEDGSREITGPAAVAIGLMLDGGIPRTIEQIVRPGYPRPGERRVYEEPQPVAKK